MRYVKQIYFWIIIATLHYVKTQTLSLFGCRNIQGVDYTDYDALEGVWYEYARTPRLAEAHGRCISFVFNTPIQGRLPVTRFQRDRFLFWQFETTDKGNSTIEGAGKGLTLSTNYNYTFLDHVYDEYLVVYSCQDYGLAKADVLWILTRERFPPCEVLLSAFQIVWDRKLWLNNLQRTDQNDCSEKWSGNPNIFEYFLEGRG